MSEIQKIIGGLLRQHRMVFWFDPEGHYREEYDALDLPEVKKMEAGLRPFRMKHFLLKENPQQKFVLYFPSPKPPDRDNWLLDIMLSQAVFQADDASLLLADLQLDESLKPYLQKYLTFFRSKKRRAAFSKYAADIDHPDDLQNAILAVLLNSSPDPFEVILQSIALYEESDALWPELEKYAISGYYLDLVHRYFEMKEENKVQDPGELVIYLFRQSPKTSCRIFMDKWRHHSKYFTLYRSVSNRIFREVIEPGKPAKKGIFPDSDLYEKEERMLLDDVGKKLESANDPGQVHSILEACRSRFWYTHYEDHYRFLHHVLHFLTMIRSFRKHTNLPDIVSAYEREDYQIDLHFRNAVFLHQQLKMPEMYQSLLDKIDAHYNQDFLQPVNEELSKSIERSKGDLLRLMRQDKIYRDQIQPVLDRGHKIALIISDGLRYEVGQELLQTMTRSGRYQGEMAMTLARIPTFTQMGMASLLPYGQVALNKNATVTHNGQPTAGIQNRTKIYQVNHPDSICISSIELLNMKTGDARKFTAGANLLVIYSDKIDAVGDSRKSEQSTFEAVEMELQHLSEVVRQANNCNFNLTVITADHGFTYRLQEVGESEKITEYEKIIREKINRRFILTEEPPGDSRLITFSPSELPYQTDCYVSFPRALNVFKVSGAGTRYLHGGLTIQELAIPVLTIKKERTTEYEAKKVPLEITSFTRKITSYTPVIKILQKEPVGDKILPREVRMGFYDQQGNELSNIADFIFTSQDPEIRSREFTFRFSFKNSITLYHRSEVYFKIRDRYQQTHEYVDYLTQPVEIFLTDEKDFDL
jgi:uncharacterized protein (TIGR02687 family)